jgi:Subtilase family
MRQTKAALAVLMALSGAFSAAPGSGASPAVMRLSAGARHARPSAVVALIDTGINPYSKAFRDRSKLAYKHPSTYLHGYPRKSKGLRLSLGLPYKKAIKKDARVWKTVQPNKLYWIPGTRIVGAISMGAGGTNCPVVDPPPANALQRTGCAEHRILDDHGHGTMTASRAAGAGHSLAPRSRIVAIEGLGAQSVTWAADQGWIDVQSNSWISLIPPPLPNAVSRAFDYASDKTLTLAASGNGSAYIAGVAPTPTYLLSTAPDGVVLVGGHDNGKMTLWAGAPPHVVADAYAGYAAPRNSTGRMRPHPIACCTSAASPYAAGGATAIVAEARKILGFDGSGMEGGVVACGPRHRVHAGPLMDGTFTMSELKNVLFHTAEAHPRKGRDDGKVHWAGDPRAPDYTEYGPGANPFCQGCTTTPVAWKDVPGQTEAYPLVGYGGINERSVALASKVLRGKKKLPPRDAADALYELDQTVRSAFFSASNEDARRMKARMCTSPTH